MGSLFLGKSKSGQGVFANKNFQSGEIVAEFRGELMKNEEIPELIFPEDDRYIQIGADEYLGPSGDFDDFFNHSCNPNSGVKIDRKKAVLVAIRNISEGEEITWDYSTTMDEDQWEMDCHCGSQVCRKKIRDFRYLPKEIQQKYIRLGIVPSYVLENLP